MKSSCPDLPAGPAPFAAVWKAAFFELPALLASGTARFTARRLKANAELLHRMNRCKTIGDLIGTQTDFIQDSSLDYAGEAERLMDDITASVVPARAP